MNKVTHAIVKSKVVYSLLLRTVMMILIVNGVALLIKSERQATSL